MSRADKREIEELREERNMLRNNINAYQAALLRSDSRAEELSKAVQVEKERYARLLERHISMMENIVGVKEVEV